MTAEVLESKVVQTKKSHRCYGCARKFSSGSILHVEKSVQDGQWCSFYLCQDCYHHTWDWGYWEWESTFMGDVAYWKDGAVWTPMHT